MAPASAHEALDMVRAGLRYLAAADAAQLPAATQAECLRGLERADSVITAARASLLAGFTAGQERSPRCGDHRFGPFQPPQALRLRRRRQLGGISGGQVAQPRADHVQRLMGRCRGHFHLATSSAGLVAAAADSPRLREKL